MAKKYPAYYQDPNGDFSTLIKAYKLHNNLNYADHLYMADIIEDMATNIGHFVAENYGYPSVYSNIAYYEAISWSGIALLSDPTGVNPYIENPIFLILYPTMSDRENIIKIFDTENGAASHTGYLPLINNNCN